ncbi:cold-shock protein [Rhodothermus marinus]|uniref:cold-shock protein n=1 Tax=Rhodothermus marinus TaxID=29549 RepID=UPI001D297D80|nr:cold shock domain-containing protein [Rhodothermus marinus]
MAVRRGVVKWFDAKKGFGFIVHPDGGADIFVHYSQIISERRFKTLRTGQVVEFELHEGPKGLHARNVVPIEERQQRAASGKQTAAPPQTRSHPVSGS